MADSKEDEALNSVKMLRNLIVIVGSSVIILFLVTVSVLFLDRHDRSNRESSAAKAKIDARVETCLAYNADQTLRRTFQVNNILTISQLTGHDVESVKDRPEFERYVAFVHDSFPYRQCSPYCVNAFYDPKVDDCGISQNESGDS